MLKAWKSKVKNIHMIKNVHLMTRDHMLDHKKAQVEMAGWSHERLKIWNLIPMTTTREDFLLEEEMEETEH